MNCVYRYIDLKDGIIKYVGIVWGKTRNLERRVYEHTRDAWYKKSEWRIEFISVDIESRTDAEYFESHYISLYHTDKYYNVSKKGWGVSKFLPDRENEWIEFQQTEMISQEDAMSVAEEYFDKLITAKSFESRRSIYNSIRLHGKKAWDEDFLESVKSNLDYLLNDYLFSSILSVASFSGYGEIILTIPILGRIKYNNFSREFVIDKDTVITQNAFPSYLKRELKKSKMIVDTIISQFEEGGCFNVKENN